MSMRRGRTQAVLKSCFGVRPVSRAERSSALPVSFWRRAVRFLRSTYAYVSRLKIKLMMHTAPAYECQYTASYREMGRYSR
jgi:hypothetical protein